jgi:hypothetical protein
MTTLWLRISSIISLLLAAGHTLGGRRQWSPMGETQVLRSMRANHFDTMGVNRSYLDFYMGFGYSLSMTLLMQAIVLWQLATLARRDASLARPMIVIFAAGNLGLSLIAWYWIFPLPATVSLLVAVTLGSAWTAATRVELRAQAS